MSWRSFVWTRETRDGDARERARREGPGQRVDEDDQQAASLEDGGTEVTSLAEVNVVGILAQMGSRMISEVSNIMFGQFTKNFQAQLEHPADAAAEEAEPLSAASVAWAAAKGALHRSS